MTTKMSSRPPIKTAEDFINEAERPINKKIPTELPWLQSGVRSDVKRDKTFKLSEPYLLKLKFISENSSYSQNAFLIQAMEKAIDDMIDLLLT